MIGNITEGNYGVSGNYNAYDIKYGETADRNGKISDDNTECETCKRRKYKDGSNENVSFKSASHLSPGEAAGAVRAHEGEHVSNAYAKAAENDGKVVMASVRIHTSVCPECGRTYVSGGVTNTAIKYGNEDNPYMKNFKEQEGTLLRGRNVDMKS